MTPGSLDYSKLSEKQILLLVVQRLDGLEGLPKRVAALERWKAWMAGLGAAALILIGWVEARR